MLSLYRFLSVFTLLYLVVNLQAQTCLPAPAGADLCENAPMMSCNLDGYVGSSATYTPGPPPFDFCGLVENDQYFRFIVDEVPVILQIVPDNCTTGKGLQAALYEGTGCSDLMPVSLCASFGFDQPLNILSNTVTVGQEVWLMVDGFEGDICDFTVNVLSGILPDVEATASDAELCLGNQISLDGTASTQRTNVEYYWTTTDGNIVSGANTMEPVVDALGEYNLLVVDVASCCIDEITVEVTENMDSPTFNFDPNYTITCTDPSLTLDPNLTNSSDYTFTWSTTDGDIDAGSSLSGTSIVVNGAGTYTLDLLDNGTGCEYTYDVVVASDEVQPDVTATSSNNIDCINTNSTINAQSMTTGLNYSWTGPNSFMSSDASFVTSDAGTYFVTVTAGNGCQNMSDVTVTSTGNPDATIDKERDLDCINTDSKLTGSSATTGVSFAWTGPSGALGSMTEITVSDPGTYTLIVSLPNGCSTTITEVVDQNATPPNVSATVSNDLDCTVSDATLEGASSTMGASYSWVGPGGFTSDIAQPSVNVGGDYTLTVTGPNGCTDDIMVSVIQDASAPVADAGNDQAIDCNNSITNVGGSNSSAGPEFTYEWTSSAIAGVLGTDPTLEVNTSGTYTLEVTNVNNNCSSTSSVDIAEDFTLPSVDAGGDAFLTCSMRDVDLGGASSSGPEYVYEWKDENDVVLSNDAIYNTTIIGSYTFTVTNTITGCTDFDVVSVTEDPYTPVASVANPDNITCALSNVTLMSSGSTTGAGIEYEWYDNNNNALFSTAINADVSNPGSYMLKVIDTNVGCADSILVRVDEDVTPPLGSAGVDKNLDCSTNEVQLEASVSGNIDDFNFTWFDDQGDQVGTTYDLTTSTAGQYDLVITDKVNGCTRESFATVIDNNVYPDADAGAPATITCAVQQVEIGGTNSSTGNNIIYEWFDSSGDLVGNSANIQVDQADTYLLVVTNASSSCSTQENVLVSMDQVEPQAAIASADLITCSEPISELDGNNSTAPNGTLTYEWTDPAGAVISNQVIADATTAGEYTLTVTDVQNGCQNFTTIMVDEDIAEPIVEVTNPEIIDCYNNFVEVNYNSLSGPITPVWKDVDGNILSYEQSYLASQVGTVVLEAISQTNGCVNTASIDIIEDKVEPEATIAAPELLTCVVTETDLVPTITNFSSEATYNWTNNLGQDLGQDSNLTVTSDGIYTLEITNVSNGCTATFYSTVDQNIEDPVAVINNVENRIDCNQPAIAIDGLMSTGNAPLDYMWTNSSGQELSNLDAFQLNEGGQITLQVTNIVNGCTSTTNVNIDEDLQAPSIAFNPVDKLTCTENAVDVESIITGANNSYTFDWEGPENLGIISGETEATAIVELIGEYTLTVVDQINGCTSTAQIMVEEDRVLPDVAVEPVAELNCITNQVTVDASNSSIGSEYTYLWSGPSILAGEGSPTIEVDQEGDYSLIIQNNITGCENTISVPVAENRERPVGATMIMEDPSCYGERDGLLDVSEVQGGTAPYLYAVNSETNFTDIATYNNLPAGEYTLIVQDVIGCEWDTLFQIENPEEVTAELGADQVLRLGEQSELFVQTTGNVISIAWSDNGVDGPIDVDYREIEPSTTTTYVVVVTNEEGCTGTDNVVVQVEDDARVYFPNAFSPNGDGVNDFFTAFVDIAVVEISSLQIFDRWGNQVFEQNNFMPNIPEVGWNGEWRGKKMPVGTYVYSSVIEFKNGNKINFKGEINIVY